jgi:hypothetical protein
MLKARPGKGVADGAAVAVAVAWVWLMALVWGMLSAKVKECLLASDSAMGSVSEKPWATA